MIAIQFARGRKLQTSSKPHEQPWREFAARFADIVLMNLDAEIKSARATLETAGVSVQTDSEDVPLTPAQESVVALVVREAVTAMLSAMLMPVVAI